MPNHIRNVWRIKNVTPDKIDYLLNKLTVSYSPDGSDDLLQILDFDLVIPEPRYIQDCPKEFRVNKDSHVSEDKNRPWFNWYTWHVTNWGTKWNTYDGYTKVGKTYITFVFSTAWSFAEPIAHKLAQLGYDLDLRFADEALGSNCGKCLYNSKTKEWTTYYEPELPNPEQFAKYIWNNY